MAQAAEWWDAVSTIFRRTAGPHSIQGRRASGCVFGGGRAGGRAGNMHFYPFLSLFFLFYPRGYILPSIIKLNSQLLYQ
jgi:hypothetical protein